jgi:predicted nucleotidyltransferase
MSIKSLMIYGSCARGDNEPYSDIDILALHSDSFYKMNAHNKINIVYYSKDLLKERVENGNLFCLHLAKEGKIVYDPEDILRDILKKFEYKNNYYKEKKEATELCWALIKFANSFDNYFYFNKKIAWCVRTIIIANSAEQRNPVFSKSDLSNFINDKSILQIINDKDSDKYHSDNLRILIDFLSIWGTEKPCWLEKINNFNETQFYFEDNTYARQVAKTFREIGYSI